MITRCKVRGQTLQHSPQNVTDQMSTTHRWADQETIQTENMLQVLTPLLIIPSYPVITRLGPQGVGGESNRTQPTMR